MTVKVKKQVGNQVKEVPQQMILLSEYEELRKIFDEQEKFIQQLNETVKDLHAALDIKSQIIDDLNMKLEKKHEKSTTIGSLRNSIANLF